MEMESLYILGTISGIILDYKTDPYVHCKGSLNKPNLDNSSHKPVTPPEICRPLENCHTVCSSRLGPVSLITYTCHSEILNPDPKPRKIVCIKFGCSVETGPLSPHVADG